MISSGFFSIHIFWFRWFCLMPYPSSLIAEIHRRLLWLVYWMDLYRSCSKNVRRSIQLAEGFWTWLKLMWVANFLEKTKPNCLNWARSASREIQVCPWHNLSESARKRCWALPDFHFTLERLLRKIWTTKIILTRSNTGREPLQV